MKFTLNVILTSLTNVSNELQGWDKDKQSHPFLPQNKRHNVFSLLVRVSCCLQPCLHFLSFLYLFLSQPSSLTTSISSSFLTFHCKFYSYCWSFFFAHTFNMSKPQLFKNFFNGLTPIIFSINSLFTHLSVSYHIAFKAFSFGWIPFF